LQWWADFIENDGSIGRKRESRILGIVSEITRRQALKVAEEHLRSLNLGKLTPFSNLTFLEFVERHFVPNAFPTLKISTQKRYRRTLDKHLLPAFRDARLGEIGTLQIQQFVLQKMQSGLSWECADHFRNLLSKTFTMAKRWGFHAGDNPASAVDLPQKTAVREKRVLTPEQIPELLQHLEEPFRTMVLLGVLTGLRIGEILGLRWKDVNLATGQLKVEQAVYRGCTGTPKTKGSRRTLPLPEPLVSALIRLQGHSARRSDETLVFSTSKGTAFSNTNLLHRVLKPAGQKIGARWIGWHTLRRTHATLLQLAGASLKDVQAQLGHTKLSTTNDIYIQPLPAHQREAVEKLSELVTNGDEFGRRLEKLPVPTTQIQ
jgi:integrase